MINKDISIYIHYPFCLSKCPYCDFNSYKISNIDEDILLKAYLKELIFYYGKTKNRKIKTIFFGGGTPSLMSVNMLNAILSKINNLWGIENVVEISIEANPTSVETKKFIEYRNLGINRISIGIQSLNDNYLKFFGRQHNRNEAIEAIKKAEKIFNEHYSIDLIYARPEQELCEWFTELEEACLLSPFHISLYQLIIAENTVFYKKKIKSLQEDKASIMYLETNNFLEDKNMNMYEISNYAKKNFECKHNINYWESGEWIGIGAGAHGRVCFGDIDKINKYLIRTAINNFNNVDKWFKSVDNKGYGAENFENLCVEEFVEEIILMGLRMRNGINLEDIKKYLDIENIENIVNDKKNLILLKDKNIVFCTKNNISINKNSFCVLDSIINKLI